MYVHIPYLIPYYRLERTETMIKKWSRFYEKEVSTSLNQNNQKEAITSGRNIVKNVVLK